MTTTIRSRSTRISKPGCRSSTYPSAFLSSARAHGRVSSIFSPSTSGTSRRPRRAATGWSTSTFTRIERRLRAGPAAPHLERTAFIGEWRTEFGGWGLLQVNPAALLNALQYPPRAQDGLRTGMHAAGKRAGRDSAPAAERAYRAGASEYEVHMEYCRACGLREEELPYNNIVAFNRNAAVLHYQFLERAAADRRRSPFTSDRRRRRIQRLRRGHYPHLFLPRPRLRRTHQPPRPHTTGALPGGRPGRRLQGNSHARAPQAR